MPCLFKTHPISSAACVTAKTLDVAVSAATMCHGQPDSSSPNILKKIKFAGFILDIPFGKRGSAALRATAKGHGARWNGKEWTLPASKYTPGLIRPELEWFRTLGLIAGVITSEYTDWVWDGRSVSLALDIPFNDRHTAKQNGAKWDSEKKRWYLPAGAVNEQTIAAFNKAEAIAGEIDMNGSVVTARPSPTVKVKYDATAGGVKLRSAALAYYALSNRHSTLMPESVVRQAFEKSSCYDDNWHWLVLTDDDGVTSSLIAFAPATPNVRIIGLDHNVALFGIVIPITAIIREMKQFPSVPHSDLLNAAYRFENKPRILCLTKVAAIEVYECLANLHKARPCNPSDKAILDLAGGWSGMLACLPMDSGPSEEDFLSPIMMRDPNGGWTPGYLGTPHDDLARAAL